MPEAWDIFIAILWTSFGTPCGVFESETNRELTGTEVEILRAIEIDSVHGRPRVLIYRSTRPSNSLKGLRGDQLKAVDDFLKECEAGGRHPALVKLYEQPDEFERLASEYLRRTLAAFAIHAAAADALTEMKSKQAWQQDHLKVVQLSGQIFISYRREDAPSAAGRLYDRLSARFSQNKIFFDIDNIDLGIDFVKAIEESVASCDVLIAIIGRHWLVTSDEQGRRRLENSEDFVRVEIGTALKRGIRVIPVLVEGASMPRSGELPDDLKPLTRRNALNLSHDRFRVDADRLVGAVERALETTRLRTA
jgi:hypothetical protein